MAVAEIQIGPGLLRKRNIMSLQVGSTGVRAHSSKEVEGRVMGIRCQEQKRTSMMASSWRRSARLRLSSVVFLRACTCFLAS